MSKLRKKEINPRKRIYPVGDKHPCWRNVERSKTCKLCGVVFLKRENEPITNFLKRKFCCKACADKGGVRYRGEENSLYRPTARRRNRGGSHRAWVNAVLSRDKAICRKCGATGIELHAHHVKPYRDHPELRFDVGNGITLCHRCHWLLHTALDEKAVNSVNTREGNTEPSLQGNLLEGVTTRGRAYRRWVGSCSYCGSIISKPLSDVKGKPNLYCNKVCMGKHRAVLATKESRSRQAAKLRGRTLSLETRKRMSEAQRRRYGSNASTNAAPERDDIV